MSSRTSVKWALALAVLLGLPAPAATETGYDLGLRYLPLADPTLRDTYRGTVATLVASDASPTARITRDELRRGLKGLLGIDVPLVPRNPAAWRWGARGRDNEERARHCRPWLGDRYRSRRPLRRRDRIGDDGPAPRHGDCLGEALGALRGAFHFLRLIQTRQPLDRLDLVERPRIDRQLLNHWDNLDGTIERGYAGSSLWAWQELPGRVDPRIEDYARANASIGINGTVLNNVNAHPDVLTAPYLERSPRLPIRCGLMASGCVPVGQLRGPSHPRLLPTRRTRSTTRWRDGGVKGRRDLHADSRLRRSSP